MLLVKKRGLFGKLFKVNYHNNVVVSFYDTVKIGKSKFIVIDILKDGKDEYKHLPTLHTNNLIVKMK